MNDNNYYLKKSKAVLREVRKSVIGKDDVYGNNCGRTCSVR